MVIIIKENRNLNKLINLSSKLLSLLYILLITGIILAGIYVLKVLNIIGLIKTICCVLTPLIIGFIIAWLFNPLVIKITEKKVPKVISALIVYIVLLFFVFMFFRLFIPVLYKQINDLIIMLPKIMSNISNLVDDISIKFYEKGIDVSNIKNNILTCLNGNVLKITSSIPRHLINTFFSFISCLGVISIGLVVGIYMLIDFDNIKISFLKIIPKKSRKDIENLIERISLEVRKTVNGTLLVALMVLVCDTIAFSFIGLPSPLLFGVLCGLTDLIPYIGPYIGGTAATVVGFTQGTKIGIIVLISCVIVQLIENYILQPIVMSKSIDSHPITIIIALLLFGHFFGIIGMIVASPILAIIKVVYDFIKKKYFA